jgi:hypothetical protein
MTAWQRCAQGSPASCWLPILLGPSTVALQLVHHSQKNAQSAGIAQVLKLLHHHDEYVAREAFLLADALIQQVFKGLRAAVGCWYL